MLFTALALVLRDLGGTVVVHCRFRAFQNERIVVVALVLIFAHFDNLGHLQYIEDIICAPHLRLLLARIKELVDLADDLITSDSWICFDVIDRKVSQLRDFAVIGCRD